MPLSNWFWHLLVVFFIQNKIFLVLGMRSGFHLKQGPYMIRLLFETRTLYNKTLALISIDCFSLLPLTVFWQGEGGRCDLITAI